MGWVFEAFAVGMIGWWIVSGLFFIWAIWGIEKAHWFSTVSCLVLYVLFLQFLGKAPIVQEAIHHPLTALSYVLGYFAAGFVWSFVKWWLFVNKIAQKRIEAREAFSKEYQPIPAHPWDSAVPETRRQESHSQKELDRRWEGVIRMGDLEKPTVAKNKGKISTWILCWPVSFLVSLLDDFVRKLVKQLVLQFRKLYDAITNGAFKNVEKAEKAVKSEPSTLDLNHHD